ncbi:MAG: hypothetical protein U0790_25815 [Isosphaeraceae bacterium]
MGLNRQTLKMLCEARSRGASFRDLLMIGRLKLTVSVPDTLRILREYGIEPPREELSEDAFEYSEKVLSWLGAQHIESLDISDYEGANLIWDLSRPIPGDWHERYDLVLDGGTMEHVFDVAQVFENYMNLVRVGGRLIVTTPANNTVGHGFYQFSPDLFYRVFSPDNGFRVEQLVLYEVYDGSPSYEVADPATFGVGLELSNAWLEVYLTIEAMRTAKTELFRSLPTQSSYGDFWEGREPSAEIRQQVRDQAARTTQTYRGLRDSLKKWFPVLRRAKQSLDRALFVRTPEQEARRASEWSRNWNLSVRQQFSFLTRPEWFRPLQTPATGKRENSGSPPASNPEAR